MSDDRRRPDPRLDPLSMPPARIERPTGAQASRGVFVTKVELDHALSEVKTDLANMLPALVQSSITQAVEIAFQKNVSTKLAKIDAMSSELATQKIVRETEARLKKEAIEEEERQMRKAEHRIKVDSWTSEVEVNQITVERLKSEPKEQRRAHRSHAKEWRIGVGVSVLAILVTILIAVMTHEAHAPHVDSAEHH